MESRLAIISVTKQLIQMLVEKNYEGFVHAINRDQVGGTVWVENEAELKEWIDNNGCDLPESDDGKIHVTNPENANGTPCEEGWLRVDEQEDITYVEVEIALNGEWTDFHIYFQFERSSFTPRVSFIGIP